MPSLTFRRKFDPAALTALILAATLTLAACGGGDGGSGDVNHRPADPQAYDRDRLPGVEREALRRGYDNSRPPCQTAVPQQIGSMITHPDYRARSP
jgi:hypothetical protein